MAQAWDNMENTFDKLTPAQSVAVQQWEEYNNPDGDQYEYADNHRVARLDNQAELDAYDDAKRAGCCGSVDVEIDTPDGKILYGFNYGH